MSIRYRLLVLVTILLGSVACDQSTKIAARSHLANQDRMSFLADTVRLDYHENPGVFLSLGADLDPNVRFWIFTVLVAVGLLAISITVTIARDIDKVSMFGWAMIVGGGVGNLLDRLYQAGRVTDFMNLGIGSVRTGIFNIADVLITGGMVVVLLVAIVRLWRERKTPDEPTPVPDG